MHFWWMNHGIDTILFIINKWLFMILDVDGCWWMLKLMFMISTINIIIFYEHPYSSINIHQQPSTSSIIYNHLSVTINKYHQISSSTIIHCYPPSSTIIYHHSLRTIIIHFHLHIHQHHQHQSTSTITH